ncbi:transcriptional regulator [[Phormidium ambiguum] IAM M-71]|uniref:Transcriptional regulator n=1 Tax=[Phormidium ambiguum] IAM M-71 TaxID=454136 RepID=A0A1U7I9S8_9CYAN|nr:Rrf2 family transcriptional regulator [Phormidium ambiguum]OKH33273.1 transcriptional regulator [Phormidium ambiguum IAM M-71]
MLDSSPNHQSHSIIELSSKLEYALLALIELASQNTKKVPLTLSEITTKQPIPERYLEQVFINLRRGGLVQSHRGAKGGYLLSREPWEITLLEIVISLEGVQKEKKRSDSCTLEKEAIYKVWQQANSAFEAILSRYTLQDLCQLRDERQHNNPMYYI